MKVDSYPLPRIDDTPDWLAGSQWFSSLDLRSGYWQVALANDAKEKTAFTLGLWHFRVMAFRLCNVPATFERLMESMLVAVPKEWTVPGQCVGVPEFDEALMRLGEVFEAIRTAKLKLHPKNASNFGIGAVLSQEQEGQEQVLTYFSHGLSKPEWNYCVTRRELLAVVAGLKHFKPYLYGTPFPLRTDHASLIWHSPAIHGASRPAGTVNGWKTDTNYRPAVPSCNGSQPHRGAQMSSAQPRRRMQS
ncbi:hypothetical protein SRHO_G00072460 [Serrasalmus rhombeus]